MFDEIRMAPVKYLTTHNSDDDKIVLYLQGKLPRTEVKGKLEKQIKEIKDCADLIRTYGSRLKVTKMLESMGMSSSKAYTLFERTQRILGTSSPHDQKFWVDILLGQIMENVKKAQAKGDFRSVASLMKTMQDTIKDLLGTADASIYERIQPPVPVIGFFPDEIKSDVPKDPEELKKIIEKFKNAKKAKFYKEIAEDVDEQQ
jgi:hypothetical protein